jgi:hypothetical protein
MKLLSALVLLACTTGTLFAQSTRPAIFVPPTGDGFDVYIAAALMKKNVPATIVTNEHDASLTLTTAQVQVQKESGRMKFVKCVMQACSDTSDKATTSVRLTNRAGAVLWSYATDGDDSSKKSLAETIAKRLKRDYFHQ